MPDASAVDNVVEVQRIKRLQDLEWLCKNSNKSKFQQITYGEVTINGKTIRTVVQTAKKDENCGY
ncbi:hypothetical protein E4U03_10315 [Rothia nasimurium]|uniref:Uncharacterized protein n=1 Tax=Rothia nasimurium TaxID=85336 RepID=A0A4Y9F1E3_9MICC|nr:hypothetical protein [Rothia nasimurium]TFU20951.1 hypothetical protein E4U03_10315 [Rothia nasimurium]